MSGEIDAHSAPVLAERLSQCTAADTDTDTAIDMSAVTFMDSSGLRVLIDVQHRVDAGAHVLVLQSPSALVVRLFEIAGLDDHFTLIR